MRHFMIISKIHNSKNRKSQNKSNEQSIVSFHSDTKEKIKASSKILASRAIVLVMIKISWQVL